MPAILMTLKTWPAAPRRPGLRRYSLLLVLREDVADDALVLRAGERLEERQVVGHRVVHAVVQEHLGRRAGVDELDGVAAVGDRVVEVPERAGHPQLVLVLAG